VWQVFPKKKNFEKIRAWSTTPFLVLELSFSYISRTKRAIFFKFGPEVGVVGPRTRAKFF
jgi:hypothetical protein